MRIRRDTSVKVRALICAAVTIVAVAGALIAGTVTGSATPAGLSADAPSTVHVQWTVHNATDQDLTAGTFSRFDLDHPASTIAVAGLKPGQSRQGSYETGYPYKVLTRADSVCNNHTVWGWDGEWTLGLKWQDVWVVSRNGNLHVSSGIDKDGKALDNLGPC